MNQIEIWDRKNTGNSIVLKLKDKHFEIFFLEKIWKFIYFKQDNDD